LLCLLGRQCCQCVLGGRQRRSLRKVRRAVPKLIGTRVEILQNEELLEFGHGHELGTKPVLTRE
jgi:hypothetical protein